MNKQETVFNYIIFSSIEFLKNFEQSEANDKPRMINLPNRIDLSSFFLS